MAQAARPAVVWMPNVELLMMLVNLSDQGPSMSPKAVHPLRREIWLKFDHHRRSPAVVETGRLLRDGFWLDAFMEIALGADPFPRAGFSHPLSRETVARASAGTDADGVDRLGRYLEYAAAFALDTKALEFLRGRDADYHGAVDALEQILGDAPATGAIEQYVGQAHRAYMVVASPLTPAGLTFGLSLQTLDGPMAFAVLGPLIGDDGKLAYGDPAFSRMAVEREFIRAFVKPLLAQHQLAARDLIRSFDRKRADWRRLGYERALDALEDQLVQCLQGRLMVRRGEAAAAEALLGFDEDTGYSWSRAVAAALEDYELHRTDFPSLEHYLPHLVEFVGAGAVAR